MTKEVLKRLRRMDVKVQHYLLSCELSLEADEVFFARASTMEYID